MKKRAKARAKKNPVLMSWGLLSLGASVVSAAATWFVKDQTQEVLRTALPPATGAATGFLVSSQLKLSSDEKIAASLLGGALGYYVSTWIDEKKRNEVCNSSWRWFNLSCYFASKQRTGLHQLSADKQVLLEKAR